MFLRFHQNLRLDVLIKKKSVHHYLHVCLFVSSYPNNMILELLDSWAKNQLLCVCLLKLNHNILILLMTLPPCNYHKAHTLAHLLPPRPQSELQNELMAPRVHQVSWSRMQMNRGYEKLVRCPIVTSDAVGLTY